MGMSSSQVRLLSLTARMHGIEYETQKLEAQKLRLAAQSGREYSKYLDALELTKLQYKAISNNGSVIYRDATLNSMENGLVSGYKGETSNKVLFLQDINNGKILLTPAIAEKYGLTSSDDLPNDMDEFIEKETGKTKTKAPVYKTVTVTDPNKITGFTPIKNEITAPSEGETTYEYAPVSNENGGVNYEALNSYAVFNNEHQNVDNSVYTITQFTDITDIVNGRTCQINSADGLNKLAELSQNSAFSDANIKIILSGNIDMSEVLNWSGIRNFKGIFDGNGYTVSNLSGIQGLFANTNNATIKNIGLENVSIEGNLSYTGGLVGYAKTTNITNCYTTGSVTSTTASAIKSLAATDNTVYSCGTGGLVGFSYVERGKTVTFDNIYSGANVKGSDGVGGLIGSSMMDYTNTVFDITNAYAIGTVIGNNGVGGFAGAMYNDEDNPNDYTSLDNCYAGGQVMGSNDVGGFFGAYLYWGDRNDPGCKITNCSASGNVTGLETNVGAFAGHLYVKLASATINTLNNYLITFTDCGYMDKDGEMPAYGIITNEKDETSATIGTASKSVTKTIEEFVQETGTSSGLVSFCFAGSIPSIEQDGSGAYMSNVLAVLAKSGKINDTDMNGEIKQNIANFLLSFNNNNEDNTKLWYLNNSICDYLQTGSNDAFPEELYLCIMDNSTDNLENYTKGEVLKGDVLRGAGSAWSRSKIQNIEKGQITVPSANTIADEVYCAMKTRGLSIEKENVREYFSKYNPDNIADKITLANINNKINTNSNLDMLLELVQNNDYKYFDDTNWGDTDLWNITVSEEYTQVEYSILNKTEEQLQGYDEYWDTTDSDISKAITKWLLSQRGFEVVTEEQASSNRWFSNMINEGAATLTTFNPENIIKLLGYSADDIASIPEEQYNQLMGIEPTNVAAELYLHEVSDEISIKKAEAQYEANLRMIDIKDRRYDMQIASLETERNAIKEEIESLKVVIKDNIGRTFKLFT